MSDLQNEQPPHILFLFSDTGGGHRSAVEAIIEALNLEFHDRITTEMVDIFRQYSPPPLKYAPKIYPTLTRLPEMWALGYRISNGRRRVHLIADSMYPYIRRSIHRLVVEHPSDMIVSVHQLTNATVLRVLRRRPMQFVTVVTDLVSTHAFWYDNRADLVIAPTEAARKRGLANGLRQDQIVVAGMPVAERYCRPLGDPIQLRARLNWPIDQPVILLVGGGEGMGPLEDTAYAIDEARLPATLVVVAGRNRRLRARLLAHPWQQRTLTYGFVRDMPDFMRAANILVTKAGPGTISEAFIAGLPMVLYSKIPGQEDGNVDYVVKEGAGVWEPDPGLVPVILRRWLAHPDERRKIADASLRLARPQATRQIARILAARLGVD
jgi:1,2-diacylglycerol 3-beta-galactosyltransferase